MFCKKVMKKVAWIVWVLICSINLVAQEDSLSKPKLLKSYSEALKLSEETGKPILTNFLSLKLVNKSNLLEEVFENKSLVDSLSEKYILYTFKRNDFNYDDFAAEAGVIYPFSMLSLNKDSIVGQFGGYKNRKEFLTMLNQCLTNKPVYEYYNDYHRNPENKDLLYSLTTVLLDQRLYDRKIFLEFVDEFPSANKNTFRIISSDTYFGKEKNKEHDELFKKLYFDFEKAGFEKHKLIKRLLRVMYAESKISKIQRAGREVIRGPKSKYNKKNAYSKLQKFLNESDDFIDSLQIFNNYTNAKWEAVYKPSQFHYQEWMTHSLPLYQYDLISIFGEEKTFEISFDLTLGIDNLEEMKDWLVILENHEGFKNKYQYVELRALCYYRMNKEELTAKILAKANELAVKEMHKFHPVLSELIKSDNITKL